jgi:hypothetical protein
MSRRFRKRFAHHTAFLANIFTFATGAIRDAGARCAISNARACNVNRDGRCPPTLGCIRAPKAMPCDHHVGSPTESRVQWWRCPVNSPDRPPPRFLAVVTRAPPDPAGPRRLCDASLAALPVQRVGITVNSMGGGYEFLSPSDEVAERMEWVQITFSERPAVDAFATSGPIVVPDAAGAASVSYEAAAADSASSSTCGQPGPPPFANRTDSFRAGCPKPQGLPRARRGTRHQSILSLNLRITVTRILASPSRIRTCYT